MHRLALFALLVIVAAKALPAAPEPVLHFDAEGSLGLRSAGQDLTARLARGRPGDSAGPGQLQL